MGCGWDRGELDNLMPVIIDYPIAIEQAFDPIRTNRQCKRTRCKDRRRFKLAAKRLWTFDFARFERRFLSHVSRLGAAPE
jgi:hypothetical protein